ncbi:MAG TPA: 2,3-bisphosphoglycerate-independent phosphoglycerate mutase [Candidatus Magasanikbacteria bacterium]|nr:2,3-bisphosphoglycerate-independent phosphoglycerate mutase [Candidatus Magasanikbacteria bacterium]
MYKYRPVVLIILDGWGVAPKGPGNAITLAKTPVLDRLGKNYPVATLHASGTEVGLSFGEMGNSEVGHLNIGAGRVYYQTLPRIDNEIETGKFLNNPVFLQAMEHVKKNKSKLHIMGLIGGKVHSNEEHLFALLKIAKQNGLKNDVFIHAFLDGRDSIYNSGKYFTEKLQAQIKELKIGKIASLTGRYWAMDRDNQWDRTEKTYKMLTEGISERKNEDPLKAIDSSYAEKNYDEEFFPTLITEKDKPVGLIEENDAVIFFNFRPDRARQLTKAFVLPAFEKFPRKKINNLFFVTMTEYEKELPVEVAYKPVVLRNVLAEVVSKAGLKQLHVAETQKYAHITFFLNGTVEEPFPGEDRFIAVSPKVSSFDEVPEMAAKEITKKVLEAVEEEKYGFIAVNFANGDMVGHTGNLEATVKSAENIDECLGEIVDKVLLKNGALVITSDHGNAEEIFNLQTGGMDKEHSTNPVPIYIVSKDLMGQAGPGGDAPEGDLSLLSPVGMLADVAPTVLRLLGLPQPEEMNGRSLV